MLTIKKNLTKFTLPLMAALSLAATGLTMSRAATGDDKPAPEAAEEKTGMQLWSDNCGTCHNIRSASTYSAVQWEPIMMHMRTVGNLTGKDARKIEEFLKTR